MSEGRTDRPLLRRTLSGPGYRLPDAPQSICGAALFLGRTTAATLSRRRCSLTYFSGWRGRREVFVQRLRLGGGAAPFRQRHNAKYAHAVGFLEGQHIAGRNCGACLGDGGAVYPDLPVTALAGGQRPAFENARMPQPLVQSLVWLRTGVVHFAPCFRPFSRPFSKSAFRPLSMAKGESGSIGFSRGFSRGFSFLRWALGWWRSALIGR